MAALIEHRSFLSDILSRQYDRRRLIDPDHAFQSQPAVTGYLPRQDDLRDEMVAGPSKRRIVNYVKEEETVRNDLSGWYVQSGEFGSNHIHGAAEHEICEECVCFPPLSHAPPT
jgi:mRNA (2'-O-methyladenosine-N6-)-methyltransferase